MRERRTPGGLQMEFSLNVEPIFLHKCREGIMCMTIESYVIVSIIKDIVDLLFFKPQFRVIYASDQQSR